MDEVSLDALTAMLAEAIVSERLARRKRLHSYLLDGG
jgi:hypothetical protein